MFTKLDVFRCTAKLAGTLMRTSVASNYDKTRRKVSDSSRKLTILPSKHVRLFGKSVPTSTAWITSVMLTWCFIGIWSRNTFSCYDTCEMWQVFGKRAPGLVKVIPFNCIAHPFYASSVAWLARARSKLGRFSMKTELFREIVVFS